MHTLLSRTSISRLALRQPPWDSICYRWDHALLQRCSILLAITRIMATSFLRAQTSSGRHIVGNVLTRNIEIWFEKSQPDTQSIIALNCLGFSCPTGQ